jgi:hypothetical protein
VPACCGRVFVVALLSVIGCNPITNVDEMVPFRRWVAKPPDTKLGDVVEVTKLKADEPLMKQLQEAWATAEASRRVVVRLPKEPAQRAILKDQPPGVTAIVLTRTSTALDLNALDQVPVEAITVEDRAPAIPEAPGWFDVGAGFGVAFNAINRDQDNDGLSRRTLVHARVAADRERRRDARGGHGGGGLRLRAVPPPLVGVLRLLALRAGRRGGGWRGAPHRRRFRRVA